MTTILLCIAWLTVVVFIAVLSAMTLHRKVPPEAFRGSEGVATAILGILGTLFAVLLGFTVIMVWDHYSDAASALHLEATHIADLRHLAQGFDPADDARIRTALSAYLSTVIRDEWPSMARGEDDARAKKALGGIWAAYRSVNTADTKQQAIYAESIAHLSQLTDARRLRLRALHDDVPGLMWIALIVGGLVVVTTTFFFVPSNVALHSALVGGVAALITLNLFLIYSLDNPFNGWPSIAPDILQQELGYLQDADPK